MPHTPGPWAVRKNKHWIDGPRVPTEDDDRTSTGVAECMMTSRPEEEWEANARLIRAAPEMLAELRWLILGNRVTVKTQKRIAALIATIEGSQNA